MFGATWGGLALRLAVCILHARHKDRRRRLTAAFLSAEAKCSLCGLRLSVGASWMDLSLRFDSPRTHTNEFGLRIMAVLPICHWKRGGGGKGRWDGNTTKLVSLASTFGNLCTLFSVCTRGGESVATRLPQGTGEARGLPTRRCPMCLLECHTSCLTDALSVLRLQAAGPLTPLTCRGAYLYAGRVHDSHRSYSVCTC